jgi:aminomethyltransferase
MDALPRTIFFDRHVALGAKIVAFGGWEMPVQYASGIVQEHLATRKQAGLFDVSHMGRFIVSGTGSLPFLQHVLSNNAAALDVGESQYTLIPNENGGALDDAYLYRFVQDAYLLVVNAANREKDWDHLKAHAHKTDDLHLVDRTFETAMLSLQGPCAKDMLNSLIDTGSLPDPLRNKLSQATLSGANVRLARTGYTGEPICFELFMENADALKVWDLLIEKGAQPVGLGARDTLRLEAALPLYGHELGEDPEQREIPIFASPLARFAVSFSPLKGNFVGRTALEKQFAAYRKIVNRDFSAIQDLPRKIIPVAVKGKGVARAGYPVFKDDGHAGFITSGTMVPYWHSTGEGLASELTDDHTLRGIGLALVDSDIFEGDALEIEMRGRRIPAVAVPFHMRSEAPPYARAIPWHALHTVKKKTTETGYPAKARSLLDQAIRNTDWRQNACINLIPSEQTQSAITRLLSITDPCGRYAEHKQVTAFGEADVFYYQATDFIENVEKLLEEELREYLGCPEVETRVISGQMANTTVFSALVDYINRTDRKREQRRLRKVMNNHIIRGGHLSAQPMGALRDFVARDPKTESPGVVNFPVLPDNPYKIDVAACADLLEEHRPELIIFGKSMTLHHEPVAAIRAMVDELGLSCTIMYDMAHVLGLIGPHFQLPFEEGADLITGSTHKTFFGTQRGVIGARFQEQDPEYGLWQAIRRRAFPGSVSNHHLGTLLGMLLATYELNHFKNEYQANIIRNAKAFAEALHGCGLDVAGDPDISFTQTHQVILNVGYARGPGIARRLEENNIIVNYQATPDEEGFTASGALRMGVQEMTRFGMQPAHFEELAGWMHAVVVEDRHVKNEVVAFRKQFVDMQYCFSTAEFENEVQKLHQLLK